MNCVWMGGGFSDQRCANILQPSSFSLLSSQIRSWNLKHNLFQNRHVINCGEPRRPRHRLWNPSAAARWHWRNFPPLWGTFFSYQAPRGPRKKTLSSSLDTHTKALQRRVLQYSVYFHMHVCMCGICCLLPVAQAGVLSSLGTRSWSFHCQSCRGWRLS